KVQQSSTFQWMVIGTLALSTLSVADVARPYDNNEVEVDFTTPEWLQNIPEESKVAKYRKRRFLTFPDGTELSIAFSFKAPTEGLPESGTFRASNTWNLDLSKDGVLGGRSIEDRHQRKTIYERLETFFDNMGHDGRSCVLRTICEVAELPFEHGVLGEVVNLILLATTGSNELTGDNLPDEYALAEHYGRTKGNCWALYNQCHVSFTNLLSSTKWLN
ncbi:unnamed protein product, partial [Meganyctiphanes norvegica]